MCQEPSREELTEQLWQISRKWHTGVGPDMTVEYALFVTSSIIRREQQIGSTILGRKAFVLQDSIIRQQDDLATIEDIAL